MELRTGTFVLPDHTNSSSTDLYDVNLFESFVTWSEAAESRRTLFRSSYSLVEYAALYVNVTGLITA